MADVDAATAPDVIAPAVTTATPIPAVTQPVTAETPAIGVSQEVAEVDDAVKPEEATTPSGAISLPAVVEAHVPRPSTDPGLLRRTPGQYHSVAPQYQQSPARRATVDHAARSEAEPPVSPPAPDGPEETSGEGSGSGSNYGANCEEPPVDSVPICSVDGAHNSDWNCEWIAYCSTEVPPVEPVPALPECAVSTPSAGQYQQAEGQYQSDPACEVAPTPVETGCAGAGAAPANVPPSEPEPAEQSTTAPAVARPHSGADGRAESPLTIARQQAAADTDGWSQVRTSHAADPDPAAAEASTQPAAVIRSEPPPRGDLPVRTKPSPVSSVAPRQFRLALGPPLGNLANARVSSGGASARGDAWLLVFAVLLAGAAAFGLSAAGPLSLWVPAVALELSARLRSKGFSRAGGIRGGSKGESSDAIRYRD